MNKINKKILLVVAVVVLIGAGLFAWKHNDSNFIKYKDLNLSSEVKAVYEKRVEDAKSELSDDSNSDPDKEFIGYLHLGRAQFGLGLLADSKKSYEKAIKAGASEEFLIANAWYELFGVQNAMQDYESAKISLDKAIAMEPTNETFLNAKALFESQER